MSPYDLHYLFKKSLWLLLGLGSPTAQRKHPRISFSSFLTDGMRTYVSACTLRTAWWIVSLIACSEMYLFRLLAILATGDQNSRFYLSIYLSIHPSVCPSIGCIVYAYMWVLMPCCTFSCTVCCSVCSDSCWGILEHCQVTWFYPSDPPPPPPSLLILWTRVRALGGGEGGQEK